MFITGAGRGLGRGLAESLAAAGGSIVVADVDRGNAETVAEAIRVSGGEALATTVDVTDEKSVDTCVSEMWDTVGAIDLVVNNAGVLSVAPVTEMEPAEWRRIIDVNATGTFLVSRAVARRMLADGIEGSIICIASIGGKRGDPGLAHYSASKFAVVGFVQALAAELGPAGITVNAVCPGVVSTDMISELADASDTPVEEMIAQQIISRPQEPAEIATAIRFLHGCRSVTGQAVNVDGGTVFN